MHISRRPTLTTGPASGQSSRSWCSPHGDVFTTRPVAQEARRPAARARAEGSAAVAVGDRHAPVPPECPLGDLDAGGRLPALVLGGVDEADHLIDVGVGQAALDQLVASEDLLDVAAEDRVEDVVVREGVVVTLVGAQLG